MKFRGMKVSTALVAIVATVGVAAPPAHAEPGWELRGERTATGDLIPISVIGTPLPEGTKACVPSAREVSVDLTLSVRTWWNPQTLEIKYEESGSGSATISTSCPGTSVTAEVEVVDYAPAGSPTLVQDGSARATTPDPRNGTTRISAYASDTTEVVYYDPVAEYQRGQSAVTVRVTGYFKNPKGASTRFGCVQATWVLMPTPYGPIYLNTDPYVSAC